MTWVAVICARMDSSRLPGKALLPLGEVPVITFLLRRLKRSELVQDFIFATTDRPVDDPLAETVLKEKLSVFRGGVDDVLGRCMAACVGSNADYFVRITGDCPFVSGETLDNVIIQCQHLMGNFDLATTKPAYPPGLDYEIAPLKLLRKINQVSLSFEEREHMMNYIYQREKEFRIVRLQPPPTLTGCNDEFLLDTEKDYLKLKQWAESDMKQYQVIR